jgi:branched-chain amino acid transport system ATP-binding protein
VGGRRRRCPKAPPEPAGRPGFGADDVFELFPKLGQRIDERAGSMSGGEQQMLAIGRALMTCPELLLVDEMSAGLAPVVVHELLAGLKRINERGIAMLLVEQSPKLIDVVGDRLYLLDQGSVAVSGSFASIGGVDAIGELYLGEKPQRG